MFILKKNDTDKDMIEIITLTKDGKRVVWGMVYSDILADITDDDDLIAEFAQEGEISIEGVRA